jgi:cell wall-associated NlpC family hydrolase
MGSQILLGEVFYIIDTAGEWLKIKLNFDNFEGWIDTDHFLLKEFTHPSSPLITDTEFEASNSQGEKVVIYPGSALYEYDENKLSFSVGPDEYTIKEKIPFSSTNESLVDTARRFINAPYLWGGRTPHGIDCSGLSQLCYKIHGRNIPRNSNTQACIGTVINLLNDALPGDLLFFDNAAGDIIHVAILLDNNHVIHASGGVRIDRVDHQGIFKTDQDRYSHQLRIIKRL